jgi:hypothetical protein
VEVAVSTASEVLVDPVVLRDQVREEYRAVAADPAGPSTSTPDERGLEE